MCEIFKNTFPYETPPVAPSDWYLDLKNLEHRTIQVSNLYQVEVFQLRSITPAIG